MDQIVTAKLQVAAALREPTDAEAQAAGELLTQLDAEARALGATASAAPVHYAMGRIWIERLGDPQSAATCYQNAFALDPRYRPNLEAARRLFASEAVWDKALALHQREESQLKEPAARAESMRAQARVLDRELKQPEAAAKLIQQALALAPDHPALLQAAVEAAARSGDRPLTARLLLRSASALKDDVQKAVLLRRAVLLLEELQQEALARLGEIAPPVRSRDGAAPPTAAELEQLSQEALRRLLSACPGDPIAMAGLVQRARARGAWDELLTLCRAQAERTGAPSDRLAVAHLAAFKLGRTGEALEELKTALLEAPQDPSLLALHTELIAGSAPKDLPAALAARAHAAPDPSERADLRIVAASYAQQPLEREQLLSEALAENPGDAAAIALHARLVAERDPGAAAERFVALGEALEGHSAEEAAAHYTEAGLWLERAGQGAVAVDLARKAMVLSPHLAAATRLLQRQLPALGGQAELARVLEEAAATAPRWQAAELLSRAAALLSDLPPPPEPAETVQSGDSLTQIAEVPPAARALDLAQRAGELARGLTGPRWLEPLTLLALRCNDAGALARSLEARADGAASAEAAELLVEAAELARAGGDDVRSAQLLRKALAADPTSTSARRALLLLPQLPVAERLELLDGEARAAEPARAASLHAERVALLEAEGNVDEAVAACALALSAGGADPAVLRRLARLQLRRGDLKAAVEVLVQLAHGAMGGQDGPARADALCRAAEVAEWRLHDLPRAEELYSAAAHSFAGSVQAQAARVRLRTWLGRWADAADGAEELAAVSAKGQKREALRLGAMLRAFRTEEPARGVALLRGLLEQEPGDLDAMAALLPLTAGDFSADGRRERVELRSRLASRCQDPRLAAMLRAESAEDRLAAGERDQGVAEYRRALALNPHDRVALDLVEEALRASNQRRLLAEHLAFRCAYEDGVTRAALALQQAELFAEEGQLEQAASAYRQALSSDPSSLLAVRGARRIAEKMGDKAEVMRLLSKEAGLSHDPGLAAGSLIEAALLAEHLGDREEALAHLGSVLERDPRNDEVAAKLRRLHGEHAAQELIALYQRIGTAHKEKTASAFAWAQAGRIQLDELGDAQEAFRSAGRALVSFGDLPEALELRADAGEEAGRFADAAEALSRRLLLAPDELAAPALQLRLGRLYAERLDDAEKALPLLLGQLDAVEVGTLVKLAPHARALPAADSTRIYRKLLEAFPVPPESGAPSRAAIAEWTDELARGCLSLGERAEALAAFRRAFQLEPRNRAALQHVAELSAADAPGEAIAVWRQLLDMTPARAEPLHALVPLFQRTGRADAAFCAAAALVGLGAANAEEKALHDQAVKAPPPAEVPQLGDLPALRGAGDDGSARDLLSAAAAELARALPTELTGRGERVKGDNPVRRICAALARALGVPEPALYLSKSELEVVAPVAAEAPGLLVGLEAPRRYAPRQQRFLYARALAWLRRGAHPIAGWSGTRLGMLVASLVQLCAPPGTDTSRLPAADLALVDALAKVIDPGMRHKLGFLCQQAANEATNFDQLALGIRESAERAALVLCGDPGSALALVSQECPGGLDRPEVARLVRFAVGDTFLSLRAR